MGFMPISYLAKINCAFLSIPFMGFVPVKVILKPEEDPFQFPLWDSFIKKINREHYDNFQFPLWDSPDPGLPPDLERASFQFPLWDS